VSDADGRDTPVMADPFDAPAAMADPFTDLVDASEVSGGQAFGRTLLELAERRDDIVLIAPDLGRGPATIAFVEAHPDRYFDTGIAETNSISLAAGLAAGGMRPFVLCMGAFLALKCAEQIRTDITMNHLPVTMVSAWGGVEMGYFGASHLALEDFAVLRGIPNLAIAAAADPFATQSLLRLAVASGAPFYLRAEPNEHPAIRRGAAPPPPVYSASPPFRWGAVHPLRDGDDVTLLATGSGVRFALAAAEELGGDGIGAAVFDVPFVKPLDAAAIVAEAERTGRLLVVEEHNRTAGLASLVAETLGRHGIAARLASAGLPDEDLTVAVPAQMLDRYGLDGHAIADQARELVRG
jgi:transketolase